MIVVLNTNSGGNEDELEAKLGELFRTEGIEVKILRAGNGVDLHDLLGRDGARQEQTIVAGGGDGTISAVANELVGTTKTLGILPLGTLNHFAKDLGIPLDLAGAVRTIARGRVAAVDVGEVNGRVFINNSGLGIYPKIVSQREVEQARLGRGKWPAFVSAALQAFRRYPFLHLRVRVEGEERSRKTAFIFIGNNEYEVTGWNLGGRACLNAGKLGFYLANRTGRFGLIRLAFRALIGRLNQAKDFEAFCIDEARIESAKRTLLVATDGEVNRMAPPLHYRIRPSALRVLVPREKGES